MDNQDIFSEIENIAKKHDLSVESVLKIANIKKIAMDESKIIEAVENNEYLVNRCFYKVMSDGEFKFPKMRHFYKVISARSVHEQKVECLVFEEHPTYWFEYQKHKTDFPGDLYLGHFDFKSFEVRSIPVSFFEDATEISNEEFNECLMTYAKELTELRWITNHSRYGEVLPNDARWEKKENSFKK